jgi:hypothetical protein
MRKISSADSCVCATSSVSVPGRVIVFRKNRAAAQVVSPICRALSTMLRSPRRRSNALCTALARRNAVLPSRVLTRSSCSASAKDLQALRGIAPISAVTIAAELGNISRFEGARQLMGYSGAVPSESSSGKRRQRGSITKTGNAHLRRIAIEAAWSYRLRPGIGPALRKRQGGVPEDIKEIAWKAQHRLHKCYSRLEAAGKDRRKIITAVGRELLGFIWAIGTRAEATAKQQRVA